MKTPMEELFEKYGHLLPDVQKEFIEKEKKQIINAYDTALNYYDEFLIGEQYYNKKFNK